MCSRGNTRLQHLAISLHSFLTGNTITLFVHEMFSKNVQTVPITATLDSTERTENVCRLLGSRVLHRRDGRLLYCGINHTHNDNNNR